MMMCSPRAAASPAVLWSAARRHLGLDVVRHDLVTRRSSTGESRSELTAAFAGGRPATDW